MDGLAKCDYLRMVRDAARRSANGDGSCGGGNREVEGRVQASALSEHVDHRAAERIAGACHILDANGIARHVISPLAVEGFSSVGGACSDDCSDLVLVHPVAEAVHRPIAEGRLEARPWTPYCIDHAAAGRRGRHGHP